VSSHAELPAFPGPAGPGGADAEYAVSPYASFGLRALGLVLDAVVLLAVATVLEVALGLHTVFWLASHSADVSRHAPSGRERLFTRALAQVSLTTSLAGFVYSVAFLASPWSATLGMRAVSIRLADEEGRRPTLGRVVARCLVQLGISAVASLVRFLGILAVVDYLWPLWDAKRQTLHDKLVRTTVVRGR
jgi:uncharacterized RDD family membrane protein YckC